MQFQELISGVYEEFELPGSRMQIRLQSHREVSLSTSLWLKPLHLGKTGAANTQPVDVRNMHTFVALCRFHSKLLYHSFLSLVYLKHIESLLLYAIVAFQVNCLGKSNGMGEHDEKTTACKGLPKQGELCNIIPWHLPGV